jgi:hypothetical protein
MLTLAVSQRPRGANGIIVIMVKMKVDLALRLRRVQASLVLENQKLKLRRMI